ncbi:MAG TPA: aminopeptidase [Candidatus Cloacimonadota bacterium]|nr:aminopeptidase [Candidatus Cloacimonadota bacterium]HQB41402.1 aminopeptidase [Candidatus Cloacimonadota bacterium]
MKKSDELRKKIGYEKKCFWTDTTKNEQKTALKFAENYKKFLSVAKTEREVIDYTVEELKNKNFANVDVPQKNNNNRRIYKIFKNKAMAIAVIGKKPISNGVNIVASHIDAPRVDLKQNPFDESSNLAILRTHYYGGIKKYQWMSTPLALHGVVIKANGERVDISIGENDNDPVFVMPDLLIHLSRKEQMNKTLSEAITASHMNVLLGSIPYYEDKEESKEAIKLNCINLIFDKYNIKEEDFLSAELYLVPAGKARDLGIDKSMVIGYGQDDRICAYTSLQALLDVMEIESDKTSVIYFFDKEEIGSDGASGANSIFFVDFIADLLKYNNEDTSSFNVRKTLIKSSVLSADVNAAINPNFPNVHEANNAIRLGYGVGIAKFTGSGGKGGSNDASSEFTAKVMKIFNDEKVNWQIGELGKVDEGGGGTIAKFLAYHGCDVIDCGPGLLSMHSLNEVCSKADLYSTYKAYKAFMQKA